MLKKKVCRFHPDRNTMVYCSKHEWGYCEECLASCRACTDPELYCRYRTSCIIWEMCRETIRRKRRDADSLPQTSE